VGVIQALLNRHRAGVAVRKLMRSFAEVNTELTALQDARARAGRGRSTMSGRGAATYGC
jgi:hypothetical protein